MAAGAVAYWKRPGIETLFQVHTRTREGELDAWTSLLDSDCDGFIAHVDSLSNMGRFFEVKSRSAGFLAGLKAAGHTLIPEHRVEGNILEEDGA